MSDPKETVQVLVVTDLDPLDALLIFNELLPEDWEISVVQDLGSEGDDEQEIQS